MEIPSPREARQSHDFQMGIGRLAHVFRELPSQAAWDDTERKLFARCLPEHIHPMLHREPTQANRGIVQIELICEGPLAGCEDCMEISAEIDYDRVGPMLDQLPSAERIAVIRMAFARRYATLHGKYEQALRAGRGDVLKLQDRLEKLEEGFTKTLHRLEEAAELQKQWGWIA